MESMQIPPPDVDPHKMSLINLPIFKPVGQSNDMDERGYLLDPCRVSFLMQRRTRKNRGCLSKSMESCGCSKKIKHGWRRLLSGNAWTYSSCKKRLGLREIFYSIGRGLEEVAVVKLSWWGSLEAK